MTINLKTLANRFRNFDNKWEEEPASFQVWYQNNSSVGNRHISWKGIWAKREASEGDVTIDMERVYKDSSYGGCDWWHLFDGLHFGLIVGPKSLAAVEECLELLRNDNPPEDDGTKVRHINHLGGVNHISKTTNHDWDLTDRIGKIMSSAFFKDREDKSLYSEDFTYVFKSHSGWNRSC